MTQATATAVVHDLIGIGFGPSNIALAIALEERARTQGELQVLFLDKQADYRWHGNTLVSQSELQISFLKDLVSLRNPTSPYSFVNYLHKHGRLVDFINLGTFYPCRMEFNDYLRWVAGHFAEQSRYGEEVLSVEPMLVERKVEALRVTSRNAEGEELVRTTRSVVVSAGGTPRIPLAFRHLKDDGRVFHHSQYLERMLKQPCVNGQPMKVAIIGGGQSAAEAFIDLNDSYPSVQVDLILRGSALKPADDSPFVNEVFAPEFTDLIYNQEGAERERLVREYHNTNYSVVDIDLIERIYGIFYRQKVSGVPRHAFRSLRSVEKATAGAEGIDDTLGDMLALGKSNGSEMPQFYRCDPKQTEPTINALLRDLRGVPSYNDLDADERVQVRRYLLCLDDTAKKVGKLSDLPAREKADLEKLRKDLTATTEYAPFWVIIAVALALGIGTMVGWKRVVLTVGEKIGKQGMTYAQGMSAQITAAAAIGMANIYSLPVSTTHVLSSGVAGTMVANKSGLHGGTVRNILMAWVLTLPTSMALSAGLFWLASQFI